MKIRSIVAVLAISPLFSIACTEDPPVVQPIEPYRTDWTTVIETNFPYIQDNAAAITKVFVGGRITSENYENRGDVIVKYDGAPGTIKVEVRKFTSAESQEVANDEFENTHVVAKTGAVSPPEMVPETENCATSWKDSCNIRIWYAGVQQPTRLGADIRVTLPSDYRHEVNVVTSDNQGDDAYLNRGNVCIENLNGRAVVQLESGVAYVTVADGATPAPLCTAAQVQACEAAGWTVDCGCAEFGNVNVTSFDNQAANIVVDVPATLWTSLRLENKSGATTGSYCPAKIDIPGVDLDPAVADTPWRAWGEVNDPGDTAPEGVGFNIVASSALCTQVAYTENPEDFVGENNDEAQPEELRGRTLACSGCLKAVGNCDALLAEGGTAVPLPEPPA